MSVVSGRLPDEELWPVASAPTTVVSGPEDDPDEAPAPPAHQSGPQQGIGPEDESKKAQSSAVDSCGSRGGPENIREAQASPGADGDPANSCQRVEKIQTPRVDDSGPENGCPITETVHASRVNDCGPENGCETVGKVQAPADEASHVRAVNSGISSSAGKETIAERRRNWLFGATFSGSSEPDDRSSVGSELRPGLAGGTELGSEPPSAESAAADCGGFELHTRTALVCQRCASPRSEVTEWESAGEAVATVLPSLGDHPDTEQCAQPPPSSPQEVHVSSSAGPSVASSSAELPVPAAATDGTSKATCHGLSNCEQPQQLPEHADAATAAPSPTRCAAAVDDRALVEPHDDATHTVAFALARAADKNVAPAAANHADQSGMTETRTIWVMGSNDDLPNLDTAGSGVHVAPSWATVSSTVRAIRLFKRGVSKRLRRPPSELATPAAASARQSVRAREHAPPDLQLRPAEPSATDVADIQPSPAADGPTPAPATALFRAFSFRRTNSWHRSLRRDRSSTGSLRRPHDHQPPADAQWSSAGADGLNAGGMLEAAGTAVLRPHVSTSAFLADSASYSVPSDAKQAIKSASYTASIADQQLKDKKDVQLKEDLRTAYWPLDHPARARLWQSICEYHGAAIGNHEEYESTVRQLEGDYGAAREGQHQMPPFVHTFYTNHYHLEAAGVWSADRVLAVLYYNNPTITYSPPLFPVCCLLLHYMDEADTYNALSMMLRNKKQSYLVQTRRDFEISWKILIRLCRKHTKSSMHYLHQLARRSENVEHVLADWMAWIFCFLPFPHAVRLMDCYLMEGEKVLYRAAMALVLIFHKMASRQMGDWGTMLQDQSIQDVMETFCTTIPVTPDKLLKTLFNIRGFSRDSLTASYARVKAQIKAGGGRLSFPERRSVKGVAKQHSQMGMPSVLSQDELAHSSSTIGVKELLRLWENLPQRFALYTPLLLYTSDEHGFSLKTFYHKVATFEPTVLLLRTTDGVVFGAYCSTSWGARNTVEEDGSRHTYFGTGETFLFTLRPQLQVFPWVGKVKQAKNPHLSSLSHSEQLFMAADHSMLTIGGGGGQAIWLDEDLSTGKTDACATFANPPLTATGMFEVACMEAFGFAPD